VGSSRCAAAAARRCHSRTACDEGWPHVRPSSIHRPLPGSRLRNRPESRSRRVTPRLAGLFCIFGCMCNTRFSMAREDVHVGVVHRARELDLKQRGWCSALGRRARRGAVRRPGEVRTIGKPQTRRSATDGSGSLRARPSCSLLPPDRSIQLLHSHAVDKLARRHRATPRAPIACSSPTLGPLSTATAIVRPSSSRSPAPDR
jgi:hypothetical protein